MEIFPQINKLKVREEKEILNLGESDSNKKISSSATRHILCRSDETLA